MAPKSVSRAQAKPLQASPARRKSSLQDAQKKEKGRSRNACDRCKQKKVKCDGEGQRVCSICRTGDYQCTYAQRPHEDKRQYRKGYVEMVEDTNSYYKTGLHQCYRVFEKAAIFNGLRAKYSVGGEPTVQEIITALGLPSTGKPFEGGISAINAHLESENRPIMKRDGEWDREVASTQIPSPDLSSDEEMEDEPDESSQDESNSPQQFPIMMNPFAQAHSNVEAALSSRLVNPQQKSPSPAAVIPAARQPSKINTTHNALTSSYLSQLNGAPGSSSPNSSPIQPGTPESIALSHYSYTMSPHHPFGQSRESLTFMNPGSAGLGGLPIQIDFNDPMAPDGTVRLSDVELQNPDPFDYWAYGPMHSRDPFAV